MKSATRQELIRQAWRARARAKSLPEGVERNRAWMEEHQAKMAYKGLPRNLQEVQA